jgi:hypothetical protein
MAIQNDSVNNAKYIKKSSTENYPFVVKINPNSMGGDFPAGHTNVTPIQYPTTPIIIADLLGNKLWNYVNLDSLKVIGKEKYTEKLTTELKKLFEYFKILNEDTNIASRQIAIMARDSLAKKLLQDTTFRKSYDQVAQTRISASYGFVQMMYTTAVGSKFEYTGNIYASTGTMYMDKNNSSTPPELLNEYSILFPRYVDYTLRHLCKTLDKKKIENVPESNWNGGYEKVWTKVFQKYNSGEVGYGKKVVNFSKKYTPLMEK